MDCPCYAATSQFAGQDPLERFPLASPTPAESLLVDLASTVLHSGLVRPVPYWQQKLLGSCSSYRYFEVKVPCWQVALERLERSVTVGTPPSGHLCVLPLAQRYHFECWLSLAGIDERALPEFAAVVVADWFAVAAVVVAAAVVAVVVTKD